MMAKATEKSSLKRARIPSREDGDSKKPRRSERISSQSHTTPLKDNPENYLPSPMTHEETSSKSDPYKEVTASPPEGRPSQIRHRSPASPIPNTQEGLSSPPAETQRFSQFAIAPKGFSSDVQDEEGEGVWGYLVPVDSVFGDTLTLRSRSACPAPYPSGHFGKGSKRRSKGQKDVDFNAEEVSYEATKRIHGFPSGGYLIGRHPECDRKLDLPTISNRHCIVFNENKNGKSTAVIEDLSSNGTFVNEALIGRNKRRELEDADEISVLDQARFMFYYPRNRDTSAFRQQYRMMQQLGKGHFATVHLCVDRASGVQYAVKRFERRHGGSNSQLDGLQQEIGVLKAVSHPNVLCLKDTFNEEDGFYLILELAPEGELFNWIVMKQKFTEEETRGVFVQLLQGLKYLHERNIVHRDIKPENILVADKELSVKLADFGLAKIVGDESFTTTLCGTPSYVAPEILKNSKQRKYTRAVDVWSLGVVLYICLCGFPPFSDELWTEEHPYNLSQQITMGRFDYPSPYWDSVGDTALDLIDKMLTVDVDKRITIDECLEHPWITTRAARVTDSTDGLTGAMDQLDFSRRKPTRERTLLSSLNSVKVSKIVETTVDQPPVTVFGKNDDGNGDRPTSNGNGIGERATESTNLPTGSSTAKPKPKPKSEAGPAAEQQAKVFMEMGGRGDQQLFGNDRASRYEPGDLAS